jgi:hypothetical protein
MTRPRIFVNIASYRDPECQWTVRDLFSKARHPERIFVGICWQVIREEDQKCFQFQTRPSQCRVIGFDARDSLGACWARHHAQSLWRGEEYTLQIDSHMRFVDGWDERLPDMLALCPSDRPVLSSYPSAYTPPDTIDSHVVATMYAQGFNRDGILKLNSVGHPPQDAPPVPAPSAFCAAGFLFADSRINVEIPYDPYLYFHGEEITLAVRLWTHGWDIFAPNDVLIYHDYNNHPERPRHWADRKDWTVLNSRSLKRAMHLLGMERSNDPEVLREIERYGLGQRRSLETYQAFSGIDFHRRLIGGKTTEQIEAESPPDTRRTRNKDVFGRIYREFGWGPGETRSGPGSTLAATGVLRDRLGELFPRLGIASLADAGCGDMNWISQISQRLTHYFGLDVVDELLADLRQRYGRRRGHFFADLDVTLDDLPACDAILCRDVLTHFPEYAVRSALSRLAGTPARYLIATTHPRGRNDPVALGDWQPVDLGAPPYSLPRPLELISEGFSDSVKALGVWRIADLKC